MVWGMAIGAAISVIGSAATAYGQYESAERQKRSLEEAEQRQFQLSMLDFLQRKGEIDTLVESTRPSELDQLIDEKAAPMQAQLDSTAENIAAAFRQAGPATGGNEGGAITEAADAEESIGKRRSEGLAAVLGLEEANADIRSRFGFLDREAGNRANQISRILGRSNQIGDRDLANAAFAGQDWRLAGQGLGIVGQGLMSYGMNIPQSVPGGSAQVFGKIPSRSVKAS